MPTKTFNTAQIKNEIISVKDFGAKGDGTTNDRPSFQSAHDALPAGGGTIHCPAGTYLIGRVIGTNDNWGFNITKSNVRLVMAEGATLKRANTITAAGDAYAIIFIGTPDSNVAAQTANVQIVGGTIEGSDVRHAIAGGSPSDQRNAIELKNTKNVEIDRVRFTKIDSASIFCQYPGQFDYGASAYYNTTKNYGLLVHDCKFLATAHSTAGRALIHAINPQGCDDVVISNNYVEWCDNFVSAETTYDAPSGVETDTYTDSNLGVSVKRTGRGWTISGNHILNASEHALYIAGMDATISGNTIRVSDAVTCNSSQIKMRCRVATVTGNSVNAAITCISIDEPSYNITVSGNTCTALVAEGVSAGCIDINSDGLLVYLTNRSDYLAPNVPMSGITVSGNTLRLPAVSQTTGYAFRVVTDSTAGTLANGHIRGLRISGNTVINAMVGVYLSSATLIRLCAIDGNVFLGKEFTDATFAAAQQSITASDAGADTFTTTTHGLSVGDAVWIDNQTTLSITSTGTGTTLENGRTYYVIAVPDPDTFKLSATKDGTSIDVTNNSTGTFRKLNALTSLAVIGIGTNDPIINHATFRSNSVSGFRYLFRTDSAAGAGRRLPRGMQDNSIQFLYHIWDLGFTAATNHNMFFGNSGSHVMDRAWRQNGTPGNSFSDGINSNSEFNSNLLVVGESDVRMYYDDKGGFKAL
jgi:hypothetical protein